MSNQIESYMKKYHTPGKLRAYILHLRAMKENGPKHPNMGICFNLNKAVNPIPGMPLESEVYDFIGYNALDWPDRVGDCDAYPVPHNKKEKYWEGSNLHYRHSLIDHVIEKARQELTMLLMEE